jgi:hypothetical protein
VEITIFVNPRESADEEFNRWYGQVHFPDILAVPGVKSGARYRARPLQHAEAPEYRYLSIYEIDGDPEAELQEVGARISNGRIKISDTVDPSTSKILIWEAI